MTREEVLRRHVANREHYVPRNCRHPVKSKRWRRIIQCSRIRKHYIDDFGFCTKHAKMVQRDLEASDEGE